MPAWSASRPAMQAVGDQIKIGRRGYRQCPAGGARQAGPLGLRRARREPDPQARAHHRPAVHDARSTRAREHFQPSSLQATIVSVPNTATNVIPGSARANFNIRYNDLHTRGRIEAWVKEQCETAAKEVDARFSLSFEGSGNVFLTKPGPLVETMRSAIRAVTGRDPALDHHRRHLGCPLHQGAVPRRRGRPTQRHGPPGGRARTGGGPHRTDGDLSAVSGEIFRGIVVIPVLVTGIHLSSRSGACGTLDPGHKARDDTSPHIVAPICQGTNSLSP